MKKKNNLFIKILQSLDYIDISEEENVDLTLTNSKGSWSNKRENYIGRRKRQ